MDTNRSNIESFFEQQNRAFVQGFESGENTVQQNLAITVPSTSSTTKHVWLNQIPQVREWIGDRLVKNIESDNMTVTNKKFEQTLEMTREEMEDDEFGIYSTLSEDMGNNARIFPDKHLVDELTRDPDWLADSAKYFGATRTYGSNTILNKTTNALTESEFDTAVETMQSYLGHNDQPIGVKPFALLVGPSLRNTAFDILQNEMRATQTSNGVAVQNHNRGLVDPYVSSRLVGSHSTKWYLLGQTGAIRGLAWQSRVAPEFQDTRLNIGSDFVFQNDKYQWGMRFRGTSFLTLPHLIYGGGL
jgi:phage major head subunit gpT-like protein